MAGGRLRPSLCDREMPTSWALDTPISALETSSWSLESPELDEPVPSAAHVRRHSPSVKKLFALPAQPPYWNLPQTHLA